MNPTTFRVTFEDGTRKHVTCVLDVDRHTSHYVRDYLSEIALRNRIFGRPAPRVVSIEEVGAVSAR